MHKGLGSGSADGSTPLAQTSSIVPNSHGANRNGPKNDRTYSLPSAGGQQVHHSMPLSPNMTSINTQINNRKTPG